MPIFTVMTRGKAPVTVEAGNWIVAMGLGIERLHGSAAIERLACEMLPNGTIIARDVQSGAGFVVKPEADSGSAVAAAAAEAAERSQPPTEAPEEQLEMGGMGAVERSTVDSASLSEVIELSDLPELPDTDAGDASQDVQHLIGQLERISDAETALLAWERGLEIGQQLTAAEAGAAVQLTSNDMLFFVAVAGGVGERLKAARLPHGTGFVGFCVDRVVGFIVEDAARDPRHYTSIDEEMDFRTRDALLMPVSFESTLFGCLELLNTQGGRGFTSDHLEMLEVIAYTVGERLFRAGVRGRRL